MKWQVTLPGTSKPKAPLPPTCRKLVNFTMRLIGFYMAFPSMPEQRTQCLHKSVKQWLREEPLSRLQYKIIVQNTSAFPSKLVQYLLSTHPPCGEHCAGYKGSKRMKRIEAALGLLLGDDQGWMQMTVKGGGQRELKKKSQRVRGGTDGPAAVPGKLQEEGHFGQAPKDRASLQPSVVEGKRQCDGNIIWHQQNLRSNPGHTTHQLSNFGQVI